MKYLSVLDHHGSRIPISAVNDYEGASTGRRMSTWGTATSGPSATIQYNLETLRSRSRELIRNNPLADGGIDSFVATVIGSGISPRWQMEDETLRMALQDMWAEWVEEADVYGRLSFYGLQSLVVRGLLDAGESLIRFVEDSAYSDMTVPLKLQVLEADHLDASYSTIAPNGNEIRMGIEVNKIGVPLGYWLWNEHPGENFINMNMAQRVFYRAADIAHVFKPMRAGQMRGRPGLASVIVKLHELDQYDDAEVVRKKGAAMFGGFILQDERKADYGDPSRYMGHKEDDTDDNDQDIIALEPGTFPKLPPGLKVEFSKPVDVGSSYEPWMKQQLRSVAKGMGITYEQLTGDLRDVNFSSIRAGINDLRRRVAQLQSEIIVFQMCRAVVHRWIVTAALSGRLDALDVARNRRKYHKVVWTPDALPSVNPLQDAQTDTLEIRAGLASRADKVASRGGDVDQVDREQAADHKREEKLGLTYQTDAGKVDQSGGAVQKGGSNEEE